jgi:hypothetical protein
MTKLKKSNGIAHLIPLLVVPLLLIALIAGYFFVNSAKTSSGNEISLYEELMGPEGQVAGLAAPIPTSQITAIPKAECDIFVSPNGTGNGSSESSPMKVINEAVAKAQPGQAVCLKGGEYRQVVKITKNGTAAAPIKIGGYTGGGLPMVSGGVNKDDQYKLPNAQCPILDSGCTRPNNGQQCKRPGCQYDTLFNVQNSSHLKLIGLDVRGSSGRGFVIGDNVTNVSIDGMRTYHNWSIGFQVRSSNPRYSTKNLDINRVAIYDNIRGMAENNIVGGGGGQILEVENVTFRNSAVFRNFGEGLNVGKAAKRVVVSDSIFWENAHTALYANGAIESTFDRNFLFCTGDKLAWMQAAPNAAIGHDVSYGAAITLRNENGVTGSFGVGTGTIASNNTIVGCSTTITVAAQNNTTLSDVIVANNTMISPRAPGKPNLSGIKFGGTLSNILVVNNIVAGGSMNSYGNGVNYINNIASHGSARNGVRIVDPKVSKLVGLTEKLEPANMDPANYVITTGSPAIGAGTKPNARGFVEKDLFGNTRGTNPIDLGSYELGGGKNWPDVYGILFAGVIAPPDDDDDTPPVDKDGDGIPDAQDACPNVPAQTPNGCPVDDDDDDIPDPDSDGDGLPDSIDECDNEPADTSNGCPIDDDPDTDPEPIVTNMLKNGGFNLAAPSTAGNMTVAANWNLARRAGGKYSANLRTLSPLGLSRGRSLQLNIEKYPQLGPVSLYQGSVDLDPNKKYEISFVAKSNKPGTINFLFTDMGYVQERIAPRVNFTLGTPWKAYKTVVQTGNYNANKLARVSILFKVPDGTLINFDSVSIKPVTK